MKDKGLERERILSEDALLNKSCDFIGKYLAVWHLHHLVDTSPYVINSGTISTLEKVLHDAAITHQTQAYFMYKEIASTLHRSIRTIEVHRRSIMRKLDVDSIAGLVKRAATMGLVDFKTEQ